VSPAKTTEAIEMPLRGDSFGFNQPCITWGPDRPNVKGQHLEVVRPI